MVISFPLILRTSENFQELASGRGVGGVEKECIETCKAGFILSGGFFPSCPIHPLMLLLSARTFRIFFIFLLSVSGAGKGRRSPRRKDGGTSIWKSIGGEGF